MYVDSVYVDSALKRAMAEKALHLFVEPRPSLPPCFRLVTTNDNGTVHPNGGTVNNVNFQRQYNRSNPPVAGDVGDDIGAADFCRQSGHGWFWRRNLLRERTRGAKSHIALPFDLFSSYPQDVGESFVTTFDTRTAWRADRLDDCLLCFSNI